MQATNFATWPVCAQMAHFDPGSCFFAYEHLGTADLYRDRRLVQIWLSNQLVPVDVHDAFVRVLCPRHQDDAIPELVDRESTQPFFSEWKPLMSSCSLV